MNMRKNDFKMSVDRRADDGCELGGDSIPKGVCSCSTARDTQINQNVWKDDQPDEGLWQLPKKLRTRQRSYSVSDHGRPPDDGDMVLSPTQELSLPFVPPRTSNSTKGKDSRTTDQEGSWSPGRLHARSNKNKKRFGKIMNITEEKMKKFN